MTKEDNVYICCFSGGKDSTAMLIHILKNNYPLDEILYVDVGGWIWTSAKKHIQEVEEKLNVKITVLNVSDEIKKGFERYGFPSFFNRWCTGVKRDAMRDYLREKYSNTKRERALCNILDTAVMKKNELVKSYTQVTVQCIL